MRSWASKIFAYASIQGVSQVLGFITGIIVVRSFPKIEYAHYGVAIAIIASVAVLSDSGINAFLMSQGAKQLHDIRALNEVFASGWRFRQRFGWIIVAGGTILLVVLLLLTGTEAAEVVLYAGLVVVNFVPLLTIGVLQAYHRLHLHVALLQRTTIGVAALRLGLVLALFFTAWMSVAALLVVNLICYTVTAVVMLRLARPGLDLSVKTNAYDRQLVSNVRRTFPMILLLVSGEQIYLLLLAIRADPVIVAEATAISRFAIAFVVASGIVSDIAAPLLARTPASRSLLAGRTALVLSAYVFVAGLIATAAGVFATPLLALLGDNYRGLEVPLVIFAIGYGAAYLGLAFDGLNQSRGWLKFSWVYLPLLAVWIVVGSLILDVSRIEGAAVLFALLPIPMILTQILRFAAGVRELPPRQAGPSSP